MLPINRLLFEEAAAILSLILAATKVDLVPPHPGTETLDFTFRLYFESENSMSSEFEIESFEGD